MAGSIVEARRFDLNIPTEMGASFRPDAIQPPAVPNQLFVRRTLVESGAPLDAVNKVLNERGDWILYGKDDLPDLYSPPLPSGAVRLELRGRLKPVYDLVDYRLRGDKFPNGYNRHGLEHIAPVSEQTELLLRRAGYEDNVVRLGVMAAEGHDLGNLVDRKRHAFEAPAIFAAIVPSLLRSPGHWAAIVNAIVLHDERVLLAEIEKWRNSSAVEDIRMLRELGPVLNALVIADKADIGRHRQNEWARTPDVLNRDEHAFVNFFGETDGIDIEEDRRGDFECVLGIRYRPDMNEAERELFHGLARKRSHHDGWAAFVPAWAHEKYRNGHNNHFGLWSQTLMRIYMNRIVLTAKCAFALFPDLKYFTIGMYDPSDQNDRKTGTKLEETFSKAGFDQQVQQLGLKYLPKEIRRPDEYEPLIRGNHAIL